MIRFLLLIAIAALLRVDETVGFATNYNRAAPLSAMSPSISALFAKKKKKKSSAGKGFGKEPETPTKPAASKSENQDLFNMEARVAAQQQGSAFTSVEGGLDTVPTMSTEQPSGDIEDRTGSILREKYGLRTREEQDAAEARMKQRQDQQKQLAEWKVLADEGEDFDLLQIIPDPILVFIDKFLKAGVVICTILFVAAGLAITVEAGSKATENPLPPQVDAFISNVVEPNFTPGLLVLLSFSVGLGLFASLQLNSAASTYREDK